ncbi:hypothetical protein PBLACG01_0024200 [Plasmodium sp.]|nr:hypothetical protein PBLACG01_0024200 [Plasmodium sp.]
MFCSFFSKYTYTTTAVFTPNIFGCIKATLCSNALSQATACIASSTSIEISSIVVAVVIINICIIALILLICLLVQNKESILEKK